MKQPLETSEQKYRTERDNLINILNTMKDGVYIVNQHYDIEYANPALIEDFGALKGQKCYEYFYNTIDPCEWCKLDEIKLGKTIRREWHYDKNQKTYDLTSTPLKNPDGSISKLEIFHNITERKQAEKKLKESEEKLRMFMDSATDGFILFDPELNYIDINSTTLQILGMNKEDLIGKNILDIAPNLKETGRYDKYLDVIKTGKPFSTEDVIFNSMDGSLQSHLSVRSFKVGENLGIIFTDITTRKKAEERLKVSENNLMERVKELTCLYGLSNLIENPNNSIEDVFQGSVDLIPPASQFPKITCARINFDNKEFKTSNFKATEWKLSSSTKILGKELNIELYYLEDKPFLKEEELLIVDIAKRLKSLVEREIFDKDLSKSEFKYRSLFNNMSEGYALCKIITDDNNKPVDFLYIEINDAFERLTGLKKEDTMGHKVTEVIPGIENSEPNLFEIYGKVALTGEPTRFEIYFEPLKIWLLISVYSPRKEYFVAIFDNITERKKAEKIVEDLAKFPSENPYPVLRVGREDVIFINKAGEILLKIKEGSKIPITLQDGVNKAFEQNEINNQEINLSNRTYSFTITPVEDVNYVNIYGMDITERKEVEEKLKEINLLKSQFLSRASHELKTPLVSIKGNTNLLLNLEYQNFDSDGLLIMDEIRDGCNRLETLIKDLIETSKLDSEEITLKTSIENLSFLIKYCVQELEGFAKERNHSITLEVHDKLITKFIKEEIHEVITNLLSNAIKYTLPGGVITIKTEVKEDFVVVSIKDNGIGITAIEKERLFQQFGKIEHYGQGLDLGINGSGLGLFISKRIVELHGGKIWEESEGRNKGSTFFFTLPYIKD